MVNKIKHISTKSIKQKLTDAESVIHVTDSDGNRIHFVFDNFKRELNILDNKTNKKWRNYDSFLKKRYNIMYVMCNESYRNDQLNKLLK